MGKFWRKYINRNNPIFYDMLTPFYKRTHSFWVFSRMALIVLLLTACLSQFDHKSIGSIVVTMIFLIATVLMFGIAFTEIRKKKAAMPIKVLTGVFSVCFGLLLSYLIMIFGSENYSLGINLGVQLLPLWIALYGLWEIKTAK